MVQVHVGKLGVVHDAGYEVARGRDRNLVAPLHRARYHSRATTTRIQYTQNFKNKSHKVQLLHALVALESF